MELQTNQSLPSKKNKRKKKGLIVKKTHITHTVPLITTSLWLWNWQMQSHLYRCYHDNSLFLSLWGWIQPGGVSGFLSQYPRSTLALQSPSRQLPDLVWPQMIFPHVPSKSMLHPQTSNLKRSTRPLIHSRAATVYRHSLCEQSSFLQASSDMLFLF